MDVGDLVTVTLCCNPTTGFEWSEEISDETVIKQVEHEFLHSEGKDDKPIAPGAAEEEIWIYEAIKEGVSIISFEYSQPWQGGEKREWTYDLTLVVESDSE
jgi:predicted secreted protein